MVHRVTSDSKRGRQMLSQRKRLIPQEAPSQLTAEQRAWNELVEAKRKFKGKPQ